MSETTHDLTQRAADWKRGKRAVWTSKLITDLSAALVQAEHREATLKAHAMPDGLKCVDLGECLYQHETVSGLEAKLVRAEQEKAELAQGAEILQEQIDNHYIPRVVIGEQKYDEETGKLGQRLGDERKRAESAEARLASQEATIRQVVEEMRNLGAGEGFYSVALMRWADTLATLLPAEQTEETDAPKADR